jgi:hypothetical protein
MRKKTHDLLELVFEVLFPIAMGLLAYLAMIAEG